MSQNNKEIEIILEEINNEKTLSGGTRMTEKEIDDMINRFENRGAQKKAIEAANNAIALGLSPDQINKITGIPLEQIMELQKQITVPTQA